MMEPKQPEQQSRANDPDSSPGWVREPAASPVEKKGAVVHEEPPMEEPGYGHGV